MATEIQDVLMQGNYAIQELVGHKIIQMWIHTCTYCMMQTFDGGKY